jgi:hypothetical protein
MNAFESGPWQAVRLPLDKPNPWVPWTACLVVCASGLFLGDRLLRPHDTTSNAALVALVVGVVLASAVVRPLRHSPNLVLNLEARRNLDTFLVCAVLSWLGMRVLLGASGNPQVGGGGLHISHMLWGGALMLAGIVINFLYLGRYGQRLIAILTGLGFGLFIDELGKFITSTNNYFYKPATPIIYSVLVLLYLFFQLMDRQRQVTSREELVNALDWTKEALIRRGDRRALGEVQAYLARAGSGDGVGESLVHLLQEIRRTAAPRPPARVHPTARSIQALYLRLVHSTWFQRLAIGGFLLLALALVAGDARTALSLAGVGPHLYLPGSRTALNFSHATGYIVCGLAALVSDSLLVAGAVLLIRSRRMDAFRLWRLGLLIAIFIEGVISFYYMQYLTVEGLLAFVAALAVVNTLIADERLNEAVGHRAGELGRPGASDQRSMELHVRAVGIHSRKEI